MSGGREEVDGRCAWLNLGELPPCGLFVLDVLLKLLQWSSISPGGVGSPRSCRSERGEVLELLVKCRFYIEFFGVKNIQHGELWSFMVIYITEKTHIIVNYCHV